WVPDSSTRAVLTVSTTRGHRWSLQWTGTETRARRSAVPSNNAGQATLRVDRAAVPHLRKVFDTALGKLDQQIELAMTGVRVSPWAGDPVSANAADRFNNHAMDGTDSALNALRAYQQRLKSAS